MPGAEQLEPARPAVGRLVTIGGVKGGSGRTTLALGLLGTLADAGHRALLLDADRTAPALGRLRLGPLAAAGRAHPLAGPGELRPWLEGLAAARAEAELVLLDLPPADPLALVAAALASDLVLVPAATSALELEAARASLGLIARARARHPDGRPGVGLVPCRIAALHPEARGHEGPLLTLGAPLAPPLRLRDGHDRALAQGLPVGRLAPGSPEDRELRAITRWLLRRLGIAERAEAAPAPSPAAAGAAPVRVGYLADPPGARGPLDLSAYTRRLRDRFLPVFRRGR